MRRRSATWCAAGKPKVIAVTAIAREMAAFLWAIAQEVAPAKRLKEPPSAEKYRAREAANDALKQARASPGRRPQPAPSTRMPRSPPPAWSACPDARRHPRWPGNIPPTGCGGQGDRRPGTPAIGHGARPWFAARIDPASPISTTKETAVVDAIAFLTISRVQACIRPLIAARSCRWP
ncbi:hypothetical protein EV128_104106 [Rhizobium azibense]|nr:hypothetical protein EV128_104106 [Rhizobium azibense]